MSETTGEAPDEKSTGSAPVADETGTTPRPRSATSRARRIGGAASEAARPAPKPRDEDKVAVAPVSVAKTEPKEPGKRGRRKKAEKAVAPSRAEGRSGGLPASLPGWAVWAPSVAFAAVAVVFLVLFVVARVGNGSDAPSGQTRERVLAAAKTCLASLNTYRYDQLDAAEAAGSKCTTGKLRSDYRRTVATIIRKNAASLQAVQQAKVNTAGIESVTKNGKQWAVLAYGQLTLTTKTIKQGRLDPFSVVARLEQVDGQWVLSKIDTVSSAA